MEPVRHGGRVPGQGRGKALREVVSRHGSQTPPGITAAGQLHGATGEHHPEEEPADQGETDPVLAQGPALTARGDRAGEDSQEASLQQEDVPLEVKERLASLQR